MGSFIIDQGASVICGHGGTCSPTVTSSRVRANGMPITTLPPSWTVSSCPLSYTASSTFCITVTWTSGATRVLAGGQPVLTQSSSGTSPETGSSPSVVSTQTRVSAT